MIQETRVSTFPQEAVVFAFSLAADITIKDEIKQTKLLWYSEDSVLTSD